MSRENLPETTGAALPIFDGEQAGTLRNETGSGDTSTTLNVEGLPSSETLFESTDQVLPEYNADPTALDLRSIETVDVPDETEDIYAQFRSSENASGDKRNVALDPERVYCNQIDKIALLGAEEEVELAQRIEAGLMAAYKLAMSNQPGELTPQLRRDLQQLAKEGQQAKQALTEANLRLVVHFLKPYRGRGMEASDLIQHGNLGLMHAVEKFDYTLGYKFSSYAGFWIKQYMRFALKTRTRIIYVPDEQLDNLQSIRDTEEDLGLALGREPTRAELAQEIGMEPAALHEFLVATMQTVSLDKKVSAQETTTLGDLLVEYSPSTAEIALAGLAGYTERLAPLLSPQEQRLLHMRYNKKQSVEDIGKELNLSDSTVKKAFGHIHSRLAHPATDLSANLDNLPPTAGVQMLVAKVWILQYFLLWEVHLSK